MPNTVILASSLFAEQVADLDFILQTGPVLLHVGLPYQMLPEMAVMHGKSSAYSQQHWATYRIKHSDRGYPSEDRSGCLPCPANASACTGLSNITTWYAGSLQKYHELIDEFGAIVMQTFTDLVIKLRVFPALELLLLALAPAILLNGM